MSQIRQVGGRGHFQLKFLKLGHYASLEKFESEIYHHGPGGLSSKNNRIRTISKFLRSIKEAHAVSFKVQFIVFLYHIESNLPQKSCALNNNEFF